MGIEHVVALAQRAQSGLTGLGPVEPVLRTLAVTGEKVLALHTLVRQAVSLVNPESGLYGRAHHLAKGCLHDIAHLVLRIHEMIARVQVSVVFYDGIPSAGLRISAGSRRCSAPIRQGAVKKIHEILSHIVPHPIIEDIAHEFAVFPRCH